MMRAKGGVVCVRPPAVHLRSRLRGIPAPVPPPAPRGQMLESADAHGWAGRRTAGALGRHHWGAAAKASLTSERGQHMRSALLRSALLYSTLLCSALLGLCFSVCCREGHTPAARTDGHPVEGPLTSYFSLVESSLG